MCIESFRFLDGEKLKEITGRSQSQLREKYRQKMTELQAFLNTPTLLSMLLSSLIFNM